MTLTVDSETVSASRPSGLVGIDSDRKFFIGGVAAGSPATGLLTSGEAVGSRRRRLFFYSLTNVSLQSRPSAISCFANVTLNGRTLDLEYDTYLLRNLFIIIFLRSNPVDSAGIGVCPGTSGAGVHYDGTGYFSFCKTAACLSILSSEFFLRLQTPILLPLSLHQGRGSQE